MTNDEIRMTNAGELLAILFRTSSVIWAFARAFPRFYRDEPVCHISVRPRPMLLLHRKTVVQDAAAVDFLGSEPKLGAD